MQNSAQKHNGMLNIKDIIERNHAEPPEVAEIRARITESFKNLEFQEGPHKYYLHNDDGSVTELPSVSSVTHMFKPYVDWDEKAAQYALKHDMAKHDVQRMWEENNVRATNNGTQTHAFGEAYMHFFMGNPDKMPDIIKPQYEKGYLIPYGEKQEAVCRFYEDLFTNDRIYPVMPEAQVYMGLNGTYAGVKPYAGTFDMLFAYKSTDIWKLLIYDWKTNKSLENDYAREFGITATGEFNDMYDEPFTYYTLQLNCYAMCLQQLRYEVSDRKIIWLLDNGEYEKYSVPNITNRLTKALKDNGK